MAHPEAEAALRRAMALHASGDIDSALAVAGNAVQRDASYAAALAYIGNTLVTRKRRFADGLAMLERAVAAEPADPALWYTLGWCREFAANALVRPKGPHQALAVDADTLYMQAREAMLHALSLDPEDGLRGDIEDILDVIARATGVEWSDGEVTPGTGPPRR